MKIFFVVHKYDEGAYVTEDETECDLPFASYDAALRALALLDEVDYKKHLNYELAREARYADHFEAKRILEAAGFPHVDKVLPGAKSFEPRQYESNYVILQLEVME